MRSCVALAGAVLAISCGGGGNQQQNGTDAGPDSGIPGQCLNTCPTAGATQCSGPQVRTCLADTSGCLSWSSPAACGGDQYCNPAQSACVACDSNCAADGVTQCAPGNTFQRCNADSNGCRFLGAASPCPQGETCDPNGQPACVTNALATTCAATSIVAGEVSGPPDAGTACRMSPQPSAFAQGTSPGHVQSLGTHRVVEDGGIPFVVEPNTGSFQILLQAVDAGTTLDLTQNGQRFNFDNWAFPLTIAQPDGGILLDANTNPPDPTDAGYWLPTAAATASAATAPNTSSTLTAWADGGVPAGTWNVVIDDFADYLCAPGTGVTCNSGASKTDTYDVSVVTRGPTPLPGTLDIGLYLVSESTTLPLENANAAAASPEVQHMIASLEKIYARAGICIRTVTIRDVPVWAKRTYSVIDADLGSPCDPMSQLFTLSKPGVNELNIFLVDSITASGGSGMGQIVGIDGAIPGPSAFGGTVNSGAVVNASDLTFQFSRCGASLDVVNCGADRVAYIAAHEGGHWMGLYHTTEAAGDAFDPLSDTGSCPCSSCVAGARLGNCVATNPNTQNPTLLLGADCNKGPSVPQCNGSQSVMFWLIDRTSVGNVSSHQGQVMRLNPVVQ